MVLSSSTKKLINVLLPDPAFPDIQYKGESERSQSLKLSHGFLCRSFPSSKNDEKSPAWDAIWVLRAYIYSVEFVSTKNWRRPLS